jgi:hypothetical protein
LQLHPDKTQIVHLARGEQGFDFLDWHRRKIRSSRRPSRFYLLRFGGRPITPSHVLETAGLDWWSCSLGPE